MMKNKLSKVLDEYSEFLKKFGIYMLIVLFIFGLAIYYMSDNGIKDKPKYGQVNNMPNIPKTQVKTEPDDVADAPEVLKQEKEKPEPDEKSRENTPAVQENKPPVDSKPSVDTKPKTEPPNQVHKEATDNTQPTKEKKSVNSTADSLQLLWPIKGELLNGYGLRYSEVYADYRLHPGIDIKAEEGAEIKAAAGGKVVLVEKSKEQNITIEIDHGNGWLTRYCHLGKALVKEGQAVKTGAEIGVIGKPGLEESVEGPHLHLELKQDQQWTDPRNYFKS